MAGLIPHPFKQGMAAEPLHRRKWQRAFTGPLRYARWLLWTALLFLPLMPRCSKSWLAFQRNIRAPVPIQPKPWRLLSARRENCISSVSIGAWTSVGGWLPVSMLRSIGLNYMLYRRMGASWRAIPTTRSLRPIRTGNPLANPVAPVTAHEGPLSLRHEVDLILRAHASVFEHDREALTPANAPSWHAPHTSIG